MPTSIPAPMPSVDIVASKALELARTSQYFSSQDIANIRDDSIVAPATWDSFTAEQQVALLNHCVTVVRNFYKRTVFNVNVR